MVDASAEIDKHLYSPCSNRMENQPDLGDYEDLLLPEENLDDQANGNVKKNGDAAKK